MEEDEEIKDVESSETKLRGHVIIAKYLLDSMKMKQEGVDTNYQWVLNQLKVKDMTDIVMTRWLTALRKCITIIDDEPLILTTLNFPWLYYNGPVVDLYIEYLGDLVSVYPLYLQLVLKTLVSLVINPDHESDFIYRNVHKAIKSILYLIPKAPLCLIKTLQVLAPYKGKQAKYQEVFLRNSLRITSYYSYLTPEILQMVVFKMLKVDVEVPPILEEEEEKEVEKVEEEDSTQFPVDMDISVSSSDQSTEEDRSHPNSTHQLEAHGLLMPHYSLHGNMDDKMADNIDVMMTVMFDYVDGICLNRGQVMSDRTIRLFHILMKIFQEHILLTHGSSHVQFLIFRLASYDPSFPSYFLDFLWQKFQDVSIPAVLRQTCSSYIGSFLARATFVPLSTTKLCLSIMLQWIHLYLDNTSDDILRADITSHRVFYSLCQTIFYVFIFHHKALLEMDNGHQFVRQLNFDRIISSKLNPLKICLPSIVEMFADITNKYEVVFCYTILEQNKRLLLPVATTPNQSNPTVQASVLETVFPFDPYHLKRSSQYVTDLYQKWTAEEETDAFLHDHTPSSFVSSSIESLVCSLTSP